MKKQAYPFVLLDISVCPEPLKKNNSFHFSAFWVLFELSGLVLPVCWREIWVWYSFLGKEELEEWSQMINVKIKLPLEFMFYKYEITEFISQMI